MDITLVLVTLLSLALAAVMTTLAWRLAREERRRSEARVAALASEIRRDDLPLRESPPVVQTADLFTSAQRSTSSPLRALGLAIVAVVALGVLSYAAFGLSRGRQTATTPAADPKSAASTA